MKKINKTVLITDLDDTLWDWLSIWSASFIPMFNEILAANTETEDQIIRAIKSIHESVGTSEYFWLLQDLESHFGRSNEFKDIKLKYEKAIVASRKNRKQAQRLYPGVLKTFEMLNEKGTKIVGYTESMSYASIQRIKSMGLDGLFHSLYSLDDHTFPESVDVNEIRMYDSSKYILKNTIHVKLPFGTIKPNPYILRGIISDLEAREEDCVYVGDNLVKDIAMAKDACVLDIHAAYGEAKNRSEYEFLKKVTHWKAEAVEKEKLTTSDDITPSFILRESFDQILDYIKFGAFK